MTTLLRSENGWVCLNPDSLLLYDWKIPTAEGVVHLPLRRGPAGFVLSHVLLWYVERIEPVFGAGDDFGYAGPNRFIGNTDVPSNHWSGTAMDLNASKHPSGTHTFDQDMIDRAHARLADTYFGVVRWGGDYRTTVDQMHWEIEATTADTRTMAVGLLDSTRGQRLLEANPTQSQYL